MVRHACGQKQQRKKKKKKRRRSRRSVSVAGISSLRKPEGSEEEEEEEGRAVNGCRELLNRGRREEEGRTWNRKLKWGRTRNTQSAMKIKSQDKSYKKVKMLAWKEDAGDGNCARREGRKEEIHARFGVNRRRRGVEPHCRGGWEVNVWLVVARAGAGR
ncbi:hypothetical protein CRG98_035348 [Punica granatum]|uniref:Uncharacterized protein n=1 Tax=Punica granatum TaxID=22663 RepID=A0A2I0IJU3_PUNGR|nr:hypothetical protein CRG98_035348 [Punica granatum]